MTKTTRKLPRNQCLREIAPIGSLLVSADGDLDVDGVGLQTSEIAVIEGSGSTLTLIGTFGFINATSGLTVQSSADVVLEGGGVNVTGTLTNQTGAQIKGFGRILMNGGTFSNNSEIIAQGGTLKIGSVAGGGVPSFNLDGNGGSATIQVMNDSTLEMPTLADAFNGTITIHQNAELKLFGFLELAGTGNPAILDLNGGSGTATVSRLPLTMGGATAAINVNSGTGIIGEGITMNGGAITIADGTKLQIDDDATLNAGTVDLGSGATLELNRDADFAVGATLNIAGSASLVINRDVTGPVIFPDDVKINQLTLNWDGSGTATTSINFGILTINSNQIDTGDPTTDGFDGTLNITDGALTVNTSSAWRMEGDMNILNSATSELEPTISGAHVIVTGDIDIESFVVASDPAVTFNSNIVEFENGSTLDVISGTAVIESLSRFQAGSNVKVTSRLNLMGSTTYGGGTIKGASTGTPFIRQGGVNVTANTTIDLGTNGRYVWDHFNGTTNINPGVTFTINAQRITAGSASSDGMDNRIDIDGGTLVVNTVGPWLMQNELRMIAQIDTPSLDGSPIVLDSGNAEITVFGGTAVLDADVTLRSGTEMRMRTAGSAFTFNGQLTFAGGNIAEDVAGRVNINNEVTVNSNSMLTVSTLNWDGFGGSGNTVTTIQPGATFTINTNQVDTNNPASDGYDDTVTINSAALVVNTPSTWLMEGFLNLDTAAGMAQIDGSPMRIRSGFFAGSGQVDVTGGGTAQILVPLTLESSATVDIAASTVLELHGDTTANNTTFAGGGTLTVASGASLTTAADSTIGVTFQNEGTLQIGSSPGILKANQYVQTDTGVLMIDIGGTNPGSEFDMLTVVGQATLDGSLDVSMINIFDPILGDVFEILTAAGGVNGTFASTLFPDLGALRSMKLFYDTNTVTLAIVPDLPGDFDLDGDVDGFDFIKWQRGESPNSLSQSDLADWDVNYGTVAPLSATSTAVPEPSSAVLLIALVAIRTLARRRGCAI